MVLTLASARSWATDDEPRFPAPCEGELAFAPAQYAIRIPPFFTNFPWVRSRIEAIQEYGQPYLSETELAALVTTMDDLEDGRGSTYRNRGTVTTLINAAEDNLTREFAARVDGVAADLERNAGVVLANRDLEHYDWLTELLARVEHYRAGISIERGAFYWQHAQHEAARVLETESDLPAWLVERRRAIATKDPDETHGNYDFVFRLNKFGPMLKRYSLRYALQRGSHRSSARSASERRGMARIPDLDAALSFLSEIPQLDAGLNRAALVGSTTIKGIVTPVLITFDSHHYFFNVRALDHDRAVAPYYQMVVGDGGRLEYLDAAPVSPEIAERRLDLTHFAY